jgi:hypothetical protein
MVYGKYQNGRPQRANLASIHGPGRESNHSANGGVQDVVQQQDEFESGSGTRNQPTVGSRRMGCGMEKSDGGSCGRSSESQETPRQASEGALDVAWNADAPMLLAVASRGEGNERGEGGAGERAEGEAGREVQRR